MREFINQNKTIVIFGTVIILILTVSLNVYFFTVGNTVAPSQQVSESEVEALLPGIDSSAGGGRPVATATPTNFTPLIATVVLLVVGFTATAVVMNISSKKNRKQDAELKDKLLSLGLAIEAYGVAKGHYPISSTYQPEHYTGIHLGKEWTNYGFPNDEEMKTYLAEWPVLKSKQLESVVYYPRENGTQFDIYAYIKTLSKDEARDYNKDSNLPEAWGRFNFRVPGKGIGNQPTQPTTDRQSVAQNTQSTIETTYNAIPTTIPTPAIQDLAQPMATMASQQMPNTPATVESAPTISTVSPITTQATLNPTLTQQSEALSATIDATPSDLQTAQSATVVLETNTMQDQPTAEVSSVNVTSAPISTLNASTEQPAQTQDNDTLPAPSESMAQIQQPVESNQFTDPVITPAIATLTQPILNPTPTDSTREPTASIADVQSILSPIVGPETTTSFETTTSAPVNTDPASLPTSESNNESKQG